MAAEPDGGYALEPIDESHEFRPPPVVAAPGAPIDLAHTDAPCLNCGYNLRGLSPQGVCPECGVPIHRSLQGNLLAFSSPEYVALLHRGLVLILVSVLASLALTLLMIAISVWSNATGVRGAIAPETIFVALAFPVAIVSLIGWWLFSTPDPAIVGNDKGDTPRKIVRVTVILAAAGTCVGMVSAMAPTTQAAVAIDSAANLFNLVAGLAQFFASMRYVAWLGPRLPDPNVTDSARRYMWLLPLIFILGMCIVVGPLIAMLMYYLLLNNVRKRLQHLRAQQSAEGAIDGASA